MSYLCAGAPRRRTRATMCKLPGSALKRNKYAEFSCELCRRGCAEVMVVRFGFQSAFAHRETTSHRPGDVHPGMRVCIQLAASTPYQKTGAFSQVFQ